MVIAENPVVTFDGTVADKSRCRRINKEYYIIGDVKTKDSGQVYQIDGTYYRESTGKITWDYQNKEYVLVNDSLVYGIVDFVDNAPVFGYFTPNFFRNCEMYQYERYVNKTTTLCISDKVALSFSNVARDIVKGCYVYDLTGATLKGFENSGIHSKSKIPGFDMGNYGFKNNEGISKLEDGFQDYLASENEFQILPFINNLSKFLKDYTFGFEFETYNGNLPVKELYKNLLLPVKDGSITGHEYVTLPLSGAEGLQVVYNACKALSKWCGVDKHCSTHIHIGNVPHDKEFIIAFYMLCYQLQMELHEMVAPYKKDVHYLANKPQGAKDHCKHIPSLGLFQNNIYTTDNKKAAIDSYFERIFTWMNDGNPSNKSHNYENGIHIKHDRPKWEIESRYHWINLFNLVFSSNKTIENRLHSGTLSATKSINWLFITIALIEFAKINQEEIIRARTKYKLDDIIQVVFGGTKEGNNLVDYLKEYIINRKNNYLKLLMKHDYIGNEFDNNDTEFPPIDKINL